MNFHSIFYAIQYCSFANLEQYWRIIPREEYILEYPSIVVEAITNEAVFWPTIVKQIDVIYTEKTA